MRKLSAALFCCLFSLLFFTGCGNQISFTWVVDHVPSNLDPQLAESGPELMAVSNLYSGLVRLDADGVPQPECAESWEVNSSKTLYTFHLKPELSYAKLKHHESEYTLTASDFVFAFQRIFDAGTNSPYASTFSSIENSMSVLQGTAASEQLGVFAPDENTVIFQLAYPDPEFLQKLALPGAMPCNKSFFESTSGAYGLTSRGKVTKNVLANGPFRLYNWNENGLFLRRDGKGNRITSLRMVINATGSPATSDSPEVQPLTGSALVTEGKATAALSDSFETPGYTSVPYTATTWALTFNTQNQILAQKSVRQALVACAQNVSLSLEDGEIPAEGLVPPAVTMNGISFREQAGNALVSFSDPAALCREGLLASGSDRLSNISVIMPEGQGCLQYAEALNQEWQKQLGAFSAFFSLKELPAEEFQQALISGNYQIALVPFSPNSNSVVEVLNQISISGISADYFEINSASLNQESRSITQLAEIEHHILADAIVYPLWYQSKSLTADPSVQGFVFRPFGPVLDLTWATRVQ